MKKVFIILMSLLVSFGIMFAGDVHSDVTAVLEEDLAAVEEQVAADQGHADTASTGEFSDDDDYDGSVAEDKATGELLTPEQPLSIRARLAEALSSARSSARSSANKLKHRIFSNGDSTPAGPVVDNELVDSFSDDEDDGDQGVLIGSATPAGPVHMSIEQFISPETYKMTHGGGIPSDDQEAEALKEESQRLAQALLSEDDRKQLLAAQDAAATSMQSLIRGRAGRKLFSTVKQAQAQEAAAEKARIEAEMAAMIAADAEPDLSPVSTPTIDPPKTPAYSGDTADPEDQVDSEDTAKKKTMGELISEYKLATSGIVAGGVAAVMSTSIIGFAFSNRDKTDAQIAAMHPLARWMTIAGLRVAYALGFKWGRKVGNLSEMASQGNNFEIGTAYQAAAAA